jgi:hypothetical protein
MRGLKLHNSMHHEFMRKGKALYQPIRLKSTLLEKHCIIACQTDHLTDIGKWMMRMTLVLLPKGTGKSFGMAIA